MKKTIFAILWILVTLAYIVGSWFAAWQYVLAHQWLKLPTTYYDIWGFIFAFDQAWAWLWLVNAQLWTLITVVIGVIIGFVVGFVFSR